MGAIQERQKLVQRNVDFFEVDFGDVLTPLPLILNIAENAAVDKESTWKVTRKENGDFRRIGQL